MTKTSWAVVIVIAILSLAVIGLGYNVWQLNIENIEGEEEETRLQAEADMNVINFNIGQSNALAEISNMFYSNDGRLILPIWDNETSQFVEVNFLTENECLQLLQEAQ